MFTSSFPLRLPASLKAAVAEISRADGTSINQFLTAAVAEKVSAMKTAEFFTSRRAKADIKAASRILRRRGGATAGTRKPFAVNTAFTYLRLLKERASRAGRITFC